MVPKKKPAAPKRNTTLGRFLAQLREAKQLTLRQVEDVADVSNAYLSQLENDRVGKPSPHILHRLAEVYGAPYEVLMQKAGYISAEAPGDGDGSARSGRLALLVSAEPTEEEEDELLAFLKYLRTRKGRGGSS
jgi:transcriptional regulator with XRE-family HTH domain